MRQRDTHIGMPKNLKTHNKEHDKITKNPVWWERKKTLSEKHCKEKYH